MSVAPDGTTFATASSDGTVKLWDARLPQRGLAIPVPGGTGPLAFTPDGQTLIVADVVRAMPLAHPGGARDDSVGASLEVSGFDPQTGGQRFDRLVDQDQNSYAWHSLTENGAIAIFARKDRTATAWEVATGKRLATIDHFHAFDRSRVVYVRRPGEPIEVVDVVFGERRALRGSEPYDFVASAPAADLVALRSGDALAIWELSTSRMRPARRGVGTAWSVAKFSPDATVLAVGESSPRHGPIQLWDVNTLELIDSLPGHSAVVVDLDFSPDGSVLASLTRNGVVKLWDVAARVELLTLQGLINPCPAIRFSPDGRTLAFRSPATDNKGFVSLLSTALPEDVTSEEGP
jgi:WD40 repeat protein